MIYLISGQQSLFKSDKYKVISAEKALEMLEPLQIVQCDTETMGLDPYTKPLLTIQLGKKENQFVFDCTQGIPSGVKEFLESDRLFIFHNAQFDLMYLYYYNIWPENIYDTMLVEQLLYLGWEDESISYALKELAKRYLNIDIDKTVRGKIITEGLTERVIVYAAGDVMYLEDIKDLQEIKVKEENLDKAVAVENSFVKCLAYVKYCGFHLDAQQWQEKMNRDNAKLNEAKEELRLWLLNYFDKKGGDRQTMMLDVEHIVDSQWIHSEEELNEFGFKMEIAPKGIKESDFYIKDSGIEEVGKLYCYKTREKFPYLEIDLQGDLWSGFNKEPQCTVNWDSPKQLIPLFESLGFNLYTFDKKTKEKKKSVGAEIIEKQINVSTIAPLYLKYKEAAKVCSSFGQNWLKAINKVSGRIHVDFKQLGTNTARLSSGGGVYKLNVQQLPRGKETRKCFTSEKGNKWISCDYDSQESQLIASVCNDPAMLDLYRNGCGDMHALVAYKSFKQIPRDTKIEDISKLYKDLRQKAKGVEFAINYGGDDNTLAQRGMSPIEAKRVYNDYMKGFPGVKAYQDYCRKAVMNDGYILMNPVTGHRAHIEDWDFLEEIRDEMKDPDFWRYYNDVKRERGPEYNRYRKYFRRKSELEKDSINYRIQNRGAMCFKLSGILLFKYIKEHNLLNKVKLCIPVHDEWNVEVPEDIAEDMAKVIVDCMEKGAAPFCKRLHLSATPEISNCWVH